MTRQQPPYPSPLPPLRDFAHLRKGLVGVVGVWGQRYSDII